MFSGHTKQEEPEDRANNFRVARDAFKIELVPTVAVGTTIADRHRPWYLEACDDGQIVFSARLFNFVNGVRVGYIDGQFSARVVDGTLTGTFTAEGNGIPGFLPRSGSFTGTRIVPEHP